MRKLTAGLFVTLDGVVESPERWPARHFDVARRWVNSGRPT